MDHLQEIQSLRQKAGKNGAPLPAAAFLKASKREVASIELLAEKFQNVLAQYPGFERGMTQQEVVDLHLKRIEVHNKFTELVMQLLEKVESRNDPEVLARSAEGRAQLLL